LFPHESAAVKRNRAPCSVSHPATAWNR